MSYGTAAYGTAPFGTLGADPPPIDTLVDGVVLTALVTAFAAMPLRDGFDASGATVGATIQQLADRIALTGTAHPRSDRTAAATDGVAYAEALAIAWGMALDEGLDLVGAASGQPIRLAALVDRLHATGVVATRVDAMTAIATVLAINGMLATGWKLEAIDSIAFQDALAGQLIAIGKVVDGAGFADSTAPALRINAITADGLALADDDAATLHAFEALREDVLFYLTLRLDGIEYAGWVLTNGAPSEYRNYPFNGFAAVELAPTRYYGTSESGLYLLEGDTDAGTPIDAWLKTALLDFGSGKQKRLPAVYVAFKGGNRLLLKVRATDERGEWSEHWYEADMPPGASLHNGRFKPGRGLKSRYWQFTLANVDGAALALDELEFHPLMLDRRL